MDIKIKDGRGSGHQAGVDNEHRLRTVATTHPLSNFASQNGKAFIVRLADTLRTVPTTGDWMMYLKNTSATDVLVLERILGSVSGAMQFQMIKNPEVSTLGNVDSSIKPLNLNFGSAIDAAAEFAAWDGSGNGLTGLSGGEIAAPLFAPGPAVVDIQMTSDWLLSPGSAIAVKANSVGGTYSLGLLMTFYFHGEW